MLEQAQPRGLGERLLALRSFPLLASLPHAELGLLARRSRERDCRAGETLAVEGDPVDTVRLLVSGRAALSRAGAPVGTAGALTCIGLLPLAAGIPHPVTALALEPIHALEVDAALVAEVLEDDFDLFVAVLRLGAGEVLARPDAPAPVAIPSPVTHRRTPDLADRLLVLRGTALFQRSPVDGLAALAKRLDVVELAAGEALPSLDPGGDLWVILEGRADLAGSFALTSNRSGASLVPGAGPGAVLGVIEGLAQRAPVASLVARTPVQLLRGTLSDLLDVLDDHHAMGRRLMSAILAR